MASQPTLFVQPSGLGQGLGPWREQVMRRMLNAAALVAPLLVAITLLLAAEPRRGLDRSVLLAAGLLPLFVRVLPGVSSRARATAMIAVILACSLYLLSRLGFVAGLAVSLLACTVLAAVYLGRRAGLAFVAITATAILAIGVAVTLGHFSIAMAETDPARLRNWIRMAVTTSLTGGIISMVVDLVIRHAEEAAGAAASALSRLRLAYRRLEHLHARLDVAKEQERSVLSGELREGLAQTLTALKLRLQIDASGAAKLDGDLGFGDTVSTVDQLIGLVRRMSGDLRPPLLEEVGLARALRAYLDEQAALSGLKIDLDAETVAAGERLPAELEIACFRVVQESMTNVLRHAAARRARVRLARTADLVSISVEDDGHGFDPGAAPRSRDRRHFGLVGMRERARARGGTFELRSRPGAGTTIAVSLPISADGSPAAVAAGISPPSPALDERSDFAAIGAWRTNIRRGMLTVAAIVTPLLAILGLFVGGAHRDAIDVTVLSTVGLLLPLLRIAGGLPVLVRVHVALTALFAAGVYVLAVGGTATGISTVLICTSLTAVICLRRGIGFAFLGASFLAHVGVGLMVKYGMVHQSAAEVDPRQLQHWVRLATLTGLLGVWLTLLVDFVIRHVEANGRAAIDTLAELQVAYTRLGELHGRLEATREEERRFLAHELHDELGQTLTAIKLRLHVESRLTDARRARSSSPEALALVDQLIALVRRISADLRPPLLDEVGLYPAVRAFVEAQAAASGTAIELRAEPDAAVPRLGPDLEILGFRVVQEAVANALRHAAARRIVVEVSGDGAGGVRLAVRDDGRGFDPASLERSDAGGRLGVVGMRERVRSVGGTFQLVSMPQAGTAVEVALSAPAPRADVGLVSEPAERIAASVSP